jgi:HSP20 family protein
MDLHEDTTNNTVMASFELPGLRKDDVQIDIHNGALTVSAEVGGSEERDRDGYAIRERRYGKFRRTLQLPQGIKVRTVFHPEWIGTSADGSPFFRRKKSKRR